MPSKYHLRNFHINDFYHIYNRGVNKSKIFKSKNDYQTFTHITRYYLTYPTGQPPSVTHQYKSRNLNPPKTNSQPPSFDLTAYCLMPNHFHFLLHQKRQPSKETNITNFMRRLSIAYAMYTKNKYDRSGALFEGRYKNVTINSQEQLLHLSRYIHQNPLKILSKDQKLSQYPYSSYPDYLNKKQRPWVHPQTILSYFPKNPSRQYRQFTTQKSDPSYLKDLTLE